MTDDQYKQWIVVAPNGNHTGLPSNSYPNFTKMVVEQILNMSWNELETLGFKLVQITITQEPKP